MSLGSALGFAGALVGNAIAPGLGTAIGMMVGTMLGNLLDPPKYEQPKPTMQAVQTSQYGAPIPIVFGTDCIAGQIIWQKWPYTEHAEKGGGKNTSPSVSSTTYSASFAVLLCEGVVDHIERIYADGRLWWPNDDGDTPFALYTGTEDQLPDPTMEAELGADNVPAYRGWAYVVFDELRLKEFGERIPQMKFGVAMKGKELGPLGQVAYNEDTDWPANVSIDSWVTTWESSPTLTSPTTSVLDPYQSIEIGVYTHRCSLVGTYVYADGTTTHLWQDYAPSAVMAAVGEAGTVMGLGNGPAPLGAADFLHAAGVADGRYCHGCALSADGRTLIAITSDDPAYTIDCDQWHRIVDGAMVAEGTIDLDGAGAKLQRGSFGVSNRGGSQCTSVAGPVLALSSIENNGEWIWQAYANTWGVNSPNYPDPPDPMIVRLLHIDPDDNVLKQYLVDPAWQSYGGPQYTTDSLSIMVTEEGYCGVIGKALPGDAAPPTTALYTRLSGGGETSLAEVIERISAKTGLLDPSEYNASLCDSIIIDGGRVGGQMEAGNALQPWRQAYFVDATERNGVIVWVPRGGDSIGILNEDDLAARPDGDAPPAIIERDRKSPIELARRVVVAFTDPTFDYQDGAMASDERQVGEARSDTTISIPIVMSPTRAKHVAKTLVWDDHKGQTARTWYTTRKQLAHEPTDVVTHPDGVDVRIDSKRMLANNVIEFSGVETGGRIYLPSSSDIGQGSIRPPQTTPAGKSNAKLWLLDIPLRTDNDDDYAIKAAIGPAEAGKSFPGATVLISRDNGSSWDEISGIGGASTMGTSTTVLARWDGGYEVDWTGRVRVQLDDVAKTLDSVPVAGLLNGANLCLLGDEVFQYGTATLVAPGLYELSVLIRGRKGTEAAADVHAAGERFVVLDTCVQIPLTAADLGQARQYKAVAHGKSVASATAQTFTNTGVALRPYSPAQLTGGANGDADVRIQWKRRARRGGEWLDFVDVPKENVAEVEYALEIWNSSYTICARTVPVILNLQRFDYTAAMQTEDFGDLQEWVYGRVAQLGPTGPGMFQPFRVRGAGGAVDEPIVSVPPIITGPIFPPPPTPGGPGPTPDVVITAANNNYHTTGLQIGQRILFAFTTRASPAVTSVTIGIGEYQDPPTSRVAKLTTDAAGTDIITQSGGLTPFLIAGALAPSTTYYVTIEAAFAFGGNPSGPVGQGCDLIIYINGAF